MHFTHKILNKKVRGGLSMRVVVLAMHTFFQETFFQPIEIEYSRRTIDIDPLFSLFSMRSFLWYVKCIALSVFHAIWLNMLCTSPVKIFTSGIDVCTRRVHRTFFPLAFHIFTPNLRGIQLDRYFLRHLCYSCLRTCYTGAWNSKIIPIYIPRWFVTQSQNYVDGLSATALLKVDVGSLSHDFS